jgi:hypothetical protein
LAITCGAIGVGLSTLLVFPALVYVSIATYGVPASPFVLAGYGVWRFLAARRPSVADPFLVSFTAPIVFVLIGFVFMVPLLVGSIVAPTLIAEIFRQWLGSRKLSTSW